DDADVRSREVAYRLLVLTRSREAVREIAATEARSVDPPLLLLGHQLEVATARRLGAFDDPVGDRGDSGVEGHGASYSCQLMPSRSVSAIAADGPQVPAAYGRGITPFSFQAARIRSIQPHCASTSSRRTNRVGSPSMRSSSNRS